MNSLISVIIPVYNHADTIERSLTTVASQTYRPLEVVFIDDGSTDGFEKKISVLKADAEASGLTVSFFRQDNKGAPAARNRGFKESIGDYVIFWDADTIGHNDMLAKMAQALIENPAASFSYSQFKFGWKKIRSQPFSADELKKNNYIDTTSLIRRADFLGFDESLKRFQDWDLWLTLAEHNKAGIFIPEVLFSKEIGGRGGIQISNWLPSFMYTLPIKTKRVNDYERAREVILKKHRLSDD